MARPGIVLGDLLDAVLPARCPGCGRRGALVCAACASELRGAPFALPPAGVTWWTSCFAYEGIARELVARAKYRNVRRFLVLVGREVARAATLAPAPIDLVSWAPASAARIRAHGVDHGELLARVVARALDARVASCLYRAPGPAQTGLDAPTRRAGPSLHSTRRLRGATILVVDDVATTGGTLAAAARALRAGDAGEVFAATIARTPSPGARSCELAYTPMTPHVSGHRGTR